MGITQMNHRDREAVTKHRISLCRNCLRGSTAFQKTDASFINIIPSTQLSAFDLHLKHLKSSTILRPLVDKCLRVDRSAQSALYHALAEQMYAVCIRFSRSRHEAEEILQEGFIKMFTCLHQYGGTGSFEGWVRKIMVNTALRRYRSQASRYPVLNIDFVSEHIATNNDDIISNLTAKELQVLIQELPTAYRMVFNLYVFEGYQHKEIAEMLNISEGTSKSNLHDARKWLKGKLVKKKNTEKVKGLHLQ